MMGQIHSGAHHWPRVPLVQVIRRAKDEITLDDEATYKQVTIRLWNRGVVQRGEQKGSEIRTKRQYRVRAGQLALSRIDVRNGAIGLIPFELDNAIVSNDFWAYDIDRANIDPSFLALFVTTPRFIEDADRTSSGTTKRIRAEEDAFLRIEIPLPPLAEQQRIVARIEALARRVEEARGLRAQAAEEAEALVKSAQRQLVGDVPEQDWLPISAYVMKIENGWSPSCESRPADEDEWGVLKVGAVSFGYFDERQNKALPKGLAPRPQYEVKPGDFIMSRANTLDLVGACAVVGKTRPKLMLSDKTFRFLFRDKETIDTHYLDHVLKSPALREQIVRHASGTSPTMKNISKEKVLGLLVPPHSLGEQHRIVAYLDGLQAKVDELTRLQAETQKELDALMPSILAKAFAGEL
jgi:type I restriction enzyme S subunit